MKSIKTCSIIGGILSFLLLCIVAHATFEQWKNGVTAKMSCADIIFSLLFAAACPIVLFFALGCLLDLVRFLIVRYTPSKGQLVLLGCGIPLTVFAFFFGLLCLMLPAMQYSREASRVMFCSNNMKRIGIALHNYHDKHGSFPPAYTVDAEGNRLHSWRTLILPYFASGAIESKWQDLYDALRLDEPWDSEYNLECYKKIAERVDEDWHDIPDSNEVTILPNDMPSVYSCSMNGYFDWSRDVSSGTFYQMIVGDNAVGNVKGTSKSQIKRPLAQTILVIEIGKPVPWMSPNDFAFEDFKTAVYINEAFKLYWEERDKPKKVSEQVCENCGEFHVSYGPVELNVPVIGVHGRQLNILFADGKVRNNFWDWKLPLSEIEAMSRIKE